MDRERSRESLRSRYEAYGAGLVGLLALAVGMYTAYLQRQQTRAQVLPVVTLEWGSGSEVALRILIQNKGTGPAFVRSSAFTVDGRPVRDWYELTDSMRKLAPTGAAPPAVDTHLGLIAGKTLAPGEASDALRVSAASRADASTEAAPMFATSATGVPLWVGHVRYEICYCSVFDECWVRAGELTPWDDAQPSAVPRCPAPSFVAVPATARASAAP